MTVAHRLPPAAGADEPHEGNGSGARRNGARSDREKAIAALNKQYAVVLVGDRPAVLREKTDAEGRRDLQVLTFGGFQEWLRPRRVLDDRTGKTLPVAKLWLEDPKRREFDGLCFAPGEDTPGYYNLWRGFAVKPSEEGSCERLLDHVYENVCQGDDHHFDWVMGWFAAIMQRPTEKTGTALVLRGSQGTGKTILGRAIGSLLGPHYLLAASPRYIVGRFNAHLASCLLLQADEGFWAGDHEAEGKLKDLVTGSDHLIEYKGREPVRIRNYVRLLITSNNRWVVPAGLDERRFAVFEVGEDRRQNSKYFRAIEEELDAGGRARLLRYLLDFDLESVNLREIPRTDALYEQKVASLGSVEQWWLDVLMRGQLPKAMFAGNVCPVDALYDHYVEHAKQVGTQRRSIGTQLGMTLRELCPALMKTRPTIPTAGGSERLYCYEFPPLKECRRNFDQVSGHTSAWGDVLEEWIAPAMPP